MKKLIVIDGNSLMHRAYYALPSMTAKNGTPTGAVYGFLSMLIKLIDYNPDYLLVAFDMHGPTFRHEVYSEYKAGRRPTPEDLRAQFPLLKNILENMEIRICECPRYEADDILGTFSRLANESGIQALLVTGDRDALQLISPMTHVLMTKKGISETIEYDEARLMEDYQLTPERMPDLKGLMGDNSDNIPGIPGVGEKTALNLIHKYGTLEETLAHASEEKGALQAKLMNNMDSARMSYQIGLIDRKAPVSIGIEDCAFSASSMRKASGIMYELELRSLINRLPGTDTVPESRVEAKELSFETIDIQNEEELLSVAKEHENAGEMAFYLPGDLYIAFEEGKQYRLSFQGTLLEPGLNDESVFSCIKILLEKDECKKYLFDAKRVRHALRKFGITLKGISFDAMIADYLLHAIHPADSLNTLCQEMYKKEGGAALLFRLKEDMEKEMKDKELWKLYGEIELPLSDVLFSMENEGCAIDADKMRALQSDFKERIDKAEKEIYKLAGEEFNILSPRQLGSILFDEDKLALPVQKRTKSGYSTDAEVMEKIMELHPIVPLIMEYRQLSKLKSTFVDVLLEKSLKEGGRIHTSFNQNVTATGRISSTDPNLQNIPVRTEVGREIRKAFIASPGNVLVDADYSQIELRLLAHISGDPTMIEAFLSGEDIHARTASEVFDTPLSEVSKAQRSAAKAVNFGIVYGISDFGLAKNLGISKKTAGEYINAYLERYPGVREYMKKSVELGREKGYVQTLLGRRRELPEIRSGNFNTRSFGERVAMNMPIQGTAADIIKAAMVKVDRALSEKNMRARLILQVHDELLVDAPANEEDAVKQILLDCMRNAMQLSVPLEVEISSGFRWSDAK